MSRKKKDAEILNIKLESAINENSNVSVKNLVRLGQQQSKDSQINALMSISKSRKHYISRVNLLIKRIASIIKIGQDNGWSWSAQSFILITQLKLEYELQNYIRYSYVWFNGRAKYFILPLSYLSEISILSVTLILDSWNMNIRIIR